MVIVAIADMFKGIIPVAIASHILDFPIWAQGAIGLATITGHSWSVFLGFSGGRGWATMIGLLFIFARWELLVLSLIGLSTHMLIKNSPLSMFLAIVSMPIAGLVLAGCGIVNFDRGLILLGIMLLILLKRILAERPIPSDELKRVLICRLVLDRDTRNRESWIYRKPDNSPQW
jgi:glycerol-3-phosphate acyltransferase PlsY